MASRSFPSRCWKYLPRVWQPAPLCLLAALILAGCGGGAKPSGLLLQGNGFHYEAPAGWAEIRKGGSVAAASGSVDRVEVVRFTLQKEYRPSLFQAASGELDRVIAGIAKQLAGTVASRSTVQIAGRRSRSYRVDYDGDKTEQIAFVLEGRTEYELLCRRKLAEPSTACDTLFASFTLG